MDAPTTEIEKPRPDFRADLDGIKQATLEPLSLARRSGLSRARIGFNGGFLSARSIRTWPATALTVFDRHSKAAFEQQQAWLLIVRAVEMSCLDHHRVMA